MSRSHAYCLLPKIRDYITNINMILIIIVRLSDNIKGEDKYH
jgi:hypothetical protein